MVSVEERLSKKQNFPASGPGGVGRANRMILLSPCDWVSGPRTDGPPSDGHDEILIMLHLPLKSQ